MDENEVSMDDLFNAGIDFGQVAKTTQDILLPAGGYRTVPALTMTTFQAAKGPNVGRFMIRYFGRVDSRKVKDDGELVARGAVGFVLSPSRVDRPDGSPDLPSKLWAMAVNAYTVASGAKASSVKEVAEFLRDYPVDLRVIQMGIPTDRNPEPTGEPGNLVVAVSAPRES